VELQGAAGGNQAHVQHLKMERLYGI